MSFSDDENSFTSKWTNDLMYGRKSILSEQRYEKNTTKNSNSHNQNIHNETKHQEDFFWPNSISKHFRPLLFILFVIKHKTNCYLKLNELPKIL